MIPGQGRTDRSISGDGPPDGPGQVERAADILARRALELARMPEATPAAGRMLQVVVFRVDGERFAVETRYVRRIERINNLTQVPSAPGRLIGVINFRGDVLAVFDLRQLVGAGGESSPSPALVVVLGHDHDEFGLGADDADDVLDLPLEAVLDPPETLDPAGRACIRGVTIDATILLDGAELLRDERLLIDED